MGAKETIDYLKKLLKEKRITMQQYRTYKGQVLSGQLSACLKGLKRKKLISKEMEMQMQEMRALAYTD